MVFVGAAALRLQLKPVASNKVRVIDTIMVCEKSKEWTARISLATETTYDGLKEWPRMNEWLGRKILMLTRLIFPVLKGARWRFWSVGLWAICGLIRHIFAGLPQRKQLQDQARLERKATYCLRTSWPFFRQNRGTCGVHELWRDISREPFEAYATMQPMPMG